MNRAILAILAAYLLNLLTQTKYASTAVSFFACALQYCCSASKCICSGVGCIAIYAIEICAIAIVSNAAVANGFMASPSRVEKKPRTRQGAFYFLSDNCSFATILATRKWAFMFPRHGSSIDRA